MILTALMLGAFACSASEAESARIVEIQITREVEVTREVEATREIKVPVKVTREVTREIEVTREVEVTREIPVTVEVTSTPTPIPSATPIPLPTSTPTVDVRDVDYVRDIEIPEDFVMEAVDVAAAYCDNRTFSVSREVNEHFDGFFSIEAGTDECRPAALAAMAVRSKQIREAYTRYVFQGNKMNECYYDFVNYSGRHWPQECDLVDLYPARHSPDYDREKLIVMFEDQPPEYPFDYLLTQDELWARDQIWRSLIRYFHFQCMRRAESEQGRVFYFDSYTYIGHLPNSIESWFHFGLTLPPYYWGTDGPDVGLCSSFDIKTRAEYEMWEYDRTYFGYLATGRLLYNADTGSLNFDSDLAAMRADPPEMPNRFAVD